MIVYKKYKIKKSNVFKKLPDFIKDKIENELPKAIDYFNDSFKQFELSYDNTLFALVLYNDNFKIPYLSLLPINDFDYDLYKHYVILLKMFVYEIFTLNKCINTIDAICEKNDDLLFDVYKSLNGKYESLDDIYAFKFTRKNFFYLDKFKSLLMDADDTVLDFKKAEEKALSETLKTIGVNPSKTNLNLYSLINASYWQKVEKNEITREECLFLRFKDFFNRINVDFDCHKAEDIYRKNLNKKHFVIDNAHEILDLLETKFNLYIISNGVLNTQLKRMKESKLDRHFIELFISDKIGYNKPSIHFFEAIRDKVIDVNKAIVIGDSLTSDIKLANNAKLKSIWFDRFNKYNNQNIKYTYSIKQLDELVFAFDHGSNCN